MPWKSSPANEDHSGERWNERNVQVEAQLEVRNAFECSNLWMAALELGENHGWVAKELDRSAVFRHYREFRPWRVLRKQYLLSCHPRE